MGRKAVWVRPNPAKPANPIQMAGYKPVHYPFKLYELKL